MSKVVDAEAQVKECPRNAQMRLDLAVALEDAGDLQRAHSEARKAISLVPTYGRAQKFLKRLQETMANQGIEPSDDALEEEEESEAEKKDETSAAEHKQKGNAFFVKQQYDDAIREYTLALQKGKDAKLLSNRAAAYLKLGKNVHAATDARASAEEDPEWWKSWWYLGQALLAILAKKGPSTANGERAQEALRAFDKCLQAPTLPMEKKLDVQHLKDRSQEKIFEMTNNPDCRVM